MRILVLVLCRNALMPVLTPLRTIALALPGFCAIISAVLSPTYLCDIVRLLHPPSTAHTVLASLACARCFGELLWDAVFGNNFGEQLWGADLQQH